MFITCMHLLWFMLCILIEISINIMHILIKTRERYMQTKGFQNVAGIRGMHFLTLNCLTLNILFKISSFFALNEIQCSSLAWEWKAVL